jgi:diphthamide biosynthesis protein 2
VEQGDLFGSPDDLVEVLGRKVFSSSLKGGSPFTCVYVGDFDPYGEETQLLQSYVVPNLGVSQCSEISFFSPLAGSQITPFKKANSLITKRYANVEKVKEAQIIGILIGTVVCDDYMLIINWLKRAIIQSGKKFYEVLVGKINEPKLRNF